MNRFPENSRLLDAYYNHSDINISPAALWTCVAGAIALLVYLFHFIWAALDYPTLPFFQILWNCFVWLMPSSLVLGLRPSLTSTSSDDSSTLSSSTEHAAKSEVLRKVFKLDDVSRAALSSGPAGSPPGLGNWDNSCYQNSVLQALASVRCLRTFFTNLRRNITDLPDDTTIASLESLVQNLNCESNFRKLLWTPHRLKSMNSWQQQDAQEYFSRLVDDMEKETVAGWKRTNPNTDQNSNATLTAIAEHMTTKAKNDKDAAQNEEASARDSMLEQRILQQLRNPVEGLLAQRVGCTSCGFTEGLSLIPFNCLTLPLGTDSSYNIGECLDEYTTLEYIEGVECPKCSLLQMKVELSRQLESLKSPQENQSVSGLQQVREYKNRLEERLETVNQALDNDDFSDSTLKDKCHMPRGGRISSTKSKQVMVMKAPQCLVLHINRSVFDEYSGAQLKNYAHVEYRNLLDLNRWCLGSQANNELNDSNASSEKWEMNPNKPMNPTQDIGSDSQRIYELRAVVTHLGRHENGHYVCYRKLPVSQEESEQDDIKPKPEAWWRLSDEKVARVDEDEANMQGGAFMLFYELVDDFLTQNNTNLAIDVNPVSFSSREFDENGNENSELGKGIDVTHLDGQKENKENDASGPTLQGLPIGINSDEPQSSTEDSDDKSEDPHSINDSASSNASISNTLEPLKEQDRSHSPLSRTEMRTARVQRQRNQDQDHDQFLASRPMVATT